MLKKLIPLTAAMLMFGFAFAAHAEKLVIDNATETSESAKPNHGVSMDQVRADFGEPTEIIPAVGTPPITRWVYPGFIVFFEYKHVIHAVSR